MLIKENVINIIEIKKSKFITLLIKLDDPSLVINTLNNIKKEYKDANHYCYAYIINTEKANDDGEPSGTAGIPILNVLKKNNLENILCVVIRYFGGIKLGSGGLIRAYSKSCSEALSKTILIKNIKYINISISIDYKTNKVIKNKIKDYIVNEQYDELITYDLQIPENEYEEIKNIIS